MKSLRYYVLPLLLITAILTTNTQAQDKLLGKIDFPNSGAAEAQADFMQGMLFLHNFEYDDAARAFRRAQEKDPDFALAYYGEAKTYNHPIWMQQDREAAMDVLKQLGETVEERQNATPTQREKDYLMSLEVLYGNTPETQDLTKQERDDAYMEYMAGLHEKYPENHEITAFYGLSILGTAHEGRDYGTYMKAAAELFDIWNANQKHPGAAHYLIHSFDDPTHAPLGLPMAKAYGEIAPAAAHAQHMTSHIFLALGMWEDVIEANIVARDVQQSRQRELNESATVCGHYPWWLQYGYLQTGEIEEARTVLNNCYDRVEDGGTSSENWHFAIMKAHQIVDTENWDQVNSWAADYTQETNGSRNYFFTQGYAAANTGDFDAASGYLEQLKQTREDVERDIQAKQLEGLILVKQGYMENGLALLEEAVAEEAKLPVAFGPPTIVKPSLELMGDVLMDIGSYEEAISYYEKQLERTPDRRRSLMGLEEGKQMATN